MPSDDINGLFFLRYTINMHKRPTRQIRGVLFDWSGTLLNNLKPSYEGWRICFAILGRPPMTLSQFRQTYCLPWQLFYRRHGISAKLLGQHPELREKYWQPQHRRIPLSPGAKPLISALRRKKIAIGILSDDPQKEIVRQLRSHRLQNAFAFIGTSEEYRPKPHPDGICAFLRRTRFKPKEVVYVGDLTDDIRAGRAAGVVTAAYLNGWHPATILRKARPDFAIHDLRKIETLLKK